jgi:hypothetical protein
LSYNDNIFGLDFLANIFRQNKKPGIQPDKCIKLPGLSRVKHINCDCFLLATQHFPVLVGLQMNRNPTNGQSLQRNKINSLDWLAQRKTYLMGDVFWLTPLPNRIVG